MEEATLEDLDNQRKAELKTKEQFEKEQAKARKNVWRNGWAPGLLQDIGGPLTKFLAVPLRSGWRYLPSLGVQRGELPPLMGTGQSLQGAMPFGIVCFDEIRPGLDLQGQVSVNVDKQ